MNKKLYEKPSSKVIELKQKPSLLQTSAKLQDYNWNNIPEE